MRNQDWNIQRLPRDWEESECRQRYELTPEKIELIEGKLSLSEEERLNMLGCLLELTGADRVVQMGDPTVWIEAAEELKKKM